ncbi:ubiquitin-like protein ATG12 [Lampetra fluviatilis]
MADESTEPGAAEAAAEVAATPTPPLPGARKKVDVLLKAVGDAPIMKQKKWSVETGKTVAWIIQFVRKYIKCDAADSLFLYVNQSFAPAPDQDVGTLFECFGSDGKLVLHYCKTQAWG